MTSAIDERPVLVVSASGRALAASGRRSGIPVVVLDLFNDQDTRQLALASACCGGLRGFSLTRLRQAARALSPRGYAALVIGSGLESRPRLLAELSRLAPLAGNDAACVALSKDPERFFALLAALGIPFPEVRLEPPESRHGWLSKRVGGAGGTHVRAAHLPICGDGRRYFQRFLPGEVMSALFLADGTRAVMVGVHRLRVVSLSGSVRFAYGGAVSLPGLSNAVASRLDGYLAGLTRALGLRGLNGLDFVAHGKDLAVLELNARPTATVDLNDERVHGGLLRAHLSACKGALPVELVTVPGARAHAILWARHRVRIPADMRWPAWICDLPAAASTIARGRPVCTVHAAAGDAVAAEALAWQRVESIWQDLQSRQR